MLDTRFKQQERDTPCPECGDYMYRWSYDNGLSWTRWTCVAYGQCELAGG